MLSKDFFVFLGRDVSLKRLLRAGGGLHFLRKSGGKITTCASLRAATWIPAGAGKAHRLVDNILISRAGYLYFAFLVLTLLFNHSTLASAPQPWQMGFQPAASPMMEGVTHMHNLLLMVITGIALFVGALLSYVMVRFRASRNPIPAKTSHHTLLEVVWTMIPVLILVVIAIPSLKLLFSMDKAQNATMTVKAIGHQWYWTYEYPEKQITYDSLMIEDKDLKPGQIRLLSVDNPIVVPVDTTVRILVTSQDVLHSFAVPALGIKKDAVPGRLNETWLRIGKEGDYYGQCSELCGIKHGFMPIHVKVVSQGEYDAWAQSQSAQSQSVQKKGTQEKIEKPPPATPPIDQGKGQDKEQQNEQ